MIFENGRIRNGYFWLVSATPTVPPEPQAAGLETENRGKCEDGRKWA